MKPSTFANRQMSIDHILNDEVLPSVSPNPSTQSSESLSSESPNEESSTGTPYVEGISNATNSGTIRPSTFAIRQMSIDHILNDEPLPIVSPNPSIQSSESLSSGPPSSESPNEESSTDTQCVEGIGNKKVTRIKLVGRWAKKQPPLPRMIIVYGNGYPSRLRSIFDRDQRKYIYKYDEHADKPIRMIFKDGKIEYILDTRTGKYLYKKPH
ncbi:hypothetical protein GGR54DRAFT_651682 [Hypoxylon sp. NC1633]|nr:hypothetical protein GGR54DRAFT_651682 [Hypoxylon sp. NC1633]